MYPFITILIIVICVILILVVLVQNPKGGGLSAAFGGGGNQTMGVRRTTDFLEKSTWYLAIAVIALSIGSAAFIEIPEANPENTKTEIQEKAENAPVNIPQPNNMPSIPGQ